MVYLLAVLLFWGMDTLSTNMSNYGQKLVPTFTTFHYNQYQGFLMTKVTYIEYDHETACLFSFS